MFKNNLPNKKNREEETAENIPNKKKNKNSDYPLISRVPTGAKIHVRLFDRAAGNISSSCYLCTLCQLSLCCYYKCNILVVLYLRLPNTLAKKRREKAGFVHTTYWDWILSSSSLHRFVSNAQHKLFHQLSILDWLIYPQPVGFSIHNHTYIHTS